MDLYVTAATFLLRHSASMPRQVALEECTKYLVNTHNATLSDASLQAFAEQSASRPTRKPG